MASDPAPPVLMCAPEFLPTVTSTQSWVIGSEPLDRGLATEQWHSLRDLTSRHVGPIKELQPEPWAPSMMFTRDLALAVDRVIVALMPHVARGPFEAPLAHRGLATMGYELGSADMPIRLDGGNVLVDSHDRLLVGVTTKDVPADLLAAVRALEAATGRSACRVPLAGGRFPHIDMALCDLNGRAWLVYPDALPGFDMADPAWHAFFLGRPVIAVEPADGEQLACNLLVRDNVAIGPEITAGLRQQIESHGMYYVATSLTEFLKAGGGAHCLTLDLPSVPPRPSVG